jgi:hypothetical protein
MADTIRQHSLNERDSVWAEAQRRARVQYGRDGVSGALHAFLLYYTGAPGARMPRRPTAAELAAAEDHAASLCA